MTAAELRNKFLQFFKEKGHEVIPSAPLLPENDPSVLFTTAGMHPLVPYLMGVSHPLGKRLTNAQKCIRTDDIDEVGDKVHQTFFEMLGNWSLGDYFKQEAILWSFEFLTSKKYLGITIERIAVSVFAGDEDSPFDEESYNIWLKLGIKPDRIAKLPKKNNWWGPAGETGPCGPDTEMFVWTGTGEPPENFQETTEDPNWVEVWNDVFMQYEKVRDGNNFKFVKLKQRNVDTGMGLERALAIINGLDDNYKTDVFSPIIAEIEILSGKKYEDFEAEFRIVADHIKAATFAIGDGAAPSNKGSGYIVRRLIRRAIVKASELGITSNFIEKIANKVFEIYKGIYFESRDHEQKIISELTKEENKFRKTLKEGLRLLDREKEITGKVLFDLYQSFGLPFEVSVEKAKQSGKIISNTTIEQFNKLKKEHQDLSRTASAGMFKGGLADAGEQTRRLHTAAHLLLAALRRVLGEHVTQKGSNITEERLRFDFSHPEKLTPEQIKEVEDLVNEQIKADKPVNSEEMKLEDAKACGAMGVFESKYGDIVKVYTIDDFSKEICGGPHAERTGELGHFKIKKEESSSSGVRRIKAVLE